MKIKLSTPSTTQWLVIANLLGLAVSIYLWHAVVSLKVLGCISGGCDIVLASPYAKIFGVPIAAFGVAYYFLNLTLTLMRFFDDHALIRLMNWKLSIFGIFASGYYLYLELFKIHAVCTWCKVSTVATIFLLVLALIEIKKAGGFKGLLKQLATLKFDKHG